MIRTMAMRLEELKKYSAPANKLARMMAQGEVFPIVRGLYETQRDMPGDLLAAGVHGLSCLAYDYALSCWHLIPEAVYVFATATCDKENLIDPRVISPMNAEAGGTSLKPMAIGYAFAFERSLLTCLPGQRPGADHVGFDVPYVYRTYTPLLIRRLSVAAVSTMMIIMSPVRPDSQFFIFPITQGYDSRTMLCPKLFYRVFELLTLGTL